MKLLSFKTWSGGPARSRHKLTARRAARIVGRLRTRDRVDGYHHSEKLRVSLRMFIAPPRGVARVPASTQPAPTETDLPLQVLRLGALAVLGEVLAPPSIENTPVQATSAEKTRNQQSKIKIMGPAPCT